MGKQPCPSCGREDRTHALDKLSPISTVKYYRCDECGHVWVVFKDGEIHHVTPLKKVERAS